MHTERCIICGAEFTPELLNCPLTKKYYPRVICKDCAKPGIYGQNHQEKAVYRHYEVPTVTPYQTLAGEIMHLVVQEYKAKYKDAIEEEFQLWQLQTGKCKPIYGDGLKQKEFLRLHKHLVLSRYHNAITYGMIEDILASARLQVEKGRKEFTILKRAGWWVLERI